MIIFCDQNHKYWWEYIYNSYTPNSPHNSKHLFDIYTQTHVFWSVLLLLITNNTIRPYSHNINKIIVLLILLLIIYFEYHENQPEQIVKYRRVEIDSTGISSYRGDSLLNLLGDIIIGLISVYIAYNSSNKINIIILVLTFITITFVVGIDYWKDFIKFVF